MYRVLIVEDEDIIRKGIAYTFDWLSMGCTIVGEAVNGKEGMEKIEELKPDIVLVDIMMPMMDGLQMIKEASQKCQFKPIIMTSYADFEYAKQAIDLGVAAYLMKPVDEEELNKSIKKTIEEIVKDNKIKQLDEKNTIYVKTQVDNDYVQHIIDVTMENYASKISIEMFSEEMGVSASYLSRKFKEATGATYLDFLNKFRVQQAVKLLETGKYKIYQVSDMTGFTDYKHFNAVFKRYTGQAPSDFQN